MRLLIVEDEQRLADTLRQLLHRQGYTADVCYDGISGLDAPTVVIELSYVNTVGTEATVTLTLGTLREDGAYYATLNDDTTVYLLNQDKIAPLLALL